MMRPRSLAVLLALSFTACGDPARQYPIADGGIPDANNGGSGGSGGAPVTVVTAGPVISANPIANWEAETHLALAAGGRVFAVWIDFQLGPGRFIGYARSTDGGATWSEPELVPSDPANAAVDPSVTADDQGVFHLAWLEKLPGGGRRVMAATYDDGSDVFSIPTVLSDPDPTARWDKPWIVNTGGGLLCAWGSDTSASLYLARSTDGTSWQTSTFAPDTTLR